jgi:hypothetical protein
MYLLFVIIFLLIVLVLLFGYYILTIKNKIEESKKISSEPKINCPLTKNKLFDTNLNIDATLNPTYDPNLFGCIYDIPSTFILNNEDIDKCPSYINSSDFTITLKDGTTKTILKNPINPKFGPITSYNLIKDYKDPNTNKVSCIYSFSTPNGIPYYPEKL